MQTVKNIFKNFWILSVLCIVLGIALIADPDFFTDTIGYVIAGLLVCYGAVMLIIYFTHSSGGMMDNGAKLVGGLLLCAAGVFVFIQPDIIAKVVAIVCGMYMLINGIVNLQGTLKMRKAGYPDWKTTGVPALITLGVGIVLVLNPMTPVKIAMTVLGIALLVSGLVNVIDCAVINHRLSKIARSSDSTELAVRDKDRDSTDIIDI
ncbi:MAG: DUF308 domain-containing protein [Ruminococcus sp.]|nr:DUF308 domain-containing protein [Ruminococcus sp.]